MEQSNKSQSQSLIDAKSNLSWLVENRSQNQKQSLALYYLNIEFSSHISVSKKYQSISQIMIGINFSLWRAVFLNHSQTDYSISHEDAVLFLETVIRTNSIGFSQDEKYRNWTFGYYVNGAKYRLYRLSQLMHVESIEDIEFGNADMREDWMRCHRALQNSMSTLRHELETHL